MFKATLNKINPDKASTIVATIVTAGVFYAGSRSPERERPIKEVLSEEKPNEIIRKSGK